MTEPLEESGDRLAVLVGDGEHDEAFLLEGLVELLHVGHLFATGRTPRGPEVEQDHAAFEGGERVGFADERRRAGSSVRGSGNVFRDLRHENTDLEQFKGILAAEIIKALDREGPSVRAAHSRMRIAAADFSRIRNADLGRFRVDRLMSIINRLGSCIEVKVKVRRGEPIEHGSCDIAWQGTDFRGHSSATAQSTPFKRTFTLYRQSGRAAAQEGKRYRSRFEQSPSSCSPIGRKNEAGIA